MKNIRMYIFHTESTYLQQKSKTRNLETVEYSLGTSRPLKVIRFEL